MSEVRDNAVRRAVSEGRAPSASGYIERALEAYETEQTWEHFLAAWQDEVGEPTSAEKRWAAAVVRTARKRR
jgi:hypothetical protein